MSVGRAKINLPNAYRLHPVQRGRGGGARDPLRHVDDGPSVDTYALHDARLLVVAEDAVMLCYRATWRRPGPGALEEEAFISSLWCRRGNGWSNVFSQDTPAHEARTSHPA